MFNFSLPDLALRQFRGDTRWVRKFEITAGITILTGLLLTSSCRLLPPLPSVNLAEPGWTIHPGQAVWRRHAEAPEIAGEVLMATNGEGRRFVQFSKPPFPMIEAQSTRKGWELNVPAEGRRYSGPGQPPAKLIWLHLPRLLSSEPAPRGWTWSITRELTWKASNLRTGEQLEGYFEK